MKWIRKKDLDRIKEILSKNKRMIGPSVVIVLILIIYLAGKSADKTVVEYHKVDGPDFSTGKVIENGSNIYQRKDRMINDKINRLEDKFKNLNVMLQDRLDEFKKIMEGQKKEERVEKEVENKGTRELEKINSEVNRVNSQKPVVFSNPGNSYQTGTVKNKNYFATSTMVNEPVPRVERGPSIISFPVKAAGAVNSTVSIPSGSFVKAKLLTGVEAPEGKALPVLLQADYAFVGPNKSRVDLSGCFLIAKSTGNLSIERVEMQATKISCVAKSGKMFERKLSGFVADDKDNSFAVMGSVNSKQDRVAVMAFLSSVVQGISGAIGQMQVSSQTSGGSTTQMVTGDQGKYIAAAGASSAAGTITQWYLKHAQGLLPTINIGSGSDVWIILQDSIELPNWYFKKTESDNGSMSFMTRLID